jgi:hypothetical protein
VYDTLEHKQKSTFSLLVISSDIWNYISNYTGTTYSVYDSLKDEMDNDIKQ